jgi:Protein of unknown function (DUF3843)
MPPQIRKSQDANKIYMAEWINHKPYDSPRKGYDEGYLNLCNKVYPLVRQFVVGLKIEAMLLPAEIAKLVTINLVSYLEDFVNEIGLWRVFTTENMRTFGKPLGIVPLSATYSTDDINKEDIHYLLWHYFMVVTDKERMLNIHNNDLEMLANAIYGLFDNALEQEEVFAIDFYEKFFTVTEKTDFFALKSKYDWVAFYSFLCGMEFTQAYHETCAGIMEDARNEGDRMPESYYNQLFYTALNAFFYTENSSMAALPTREILAQILHTNDKMRQKIRNTWHYAQVSCFINTQISARLFELQIIGTKQRLLLDINTLSPYAQKDVKPKITISASLLKWGETYCVSGGFLILGGVEVANGILENIKQNPAQGSANNALLDEENLANILQMQEQIGIAFEAYFGSNIVFTDNSKQMKERYTTFIQWQNENVPQYSNGKVDNDKARSPAYWQKCADTAALRTFRSSLPEITDQFFAVIPNVGIIMNKLEDLAKVPSITKKGQNITKAEANILFNCITSGHPVLSTHLIKQYDFSASGFKHNPTPEQNALFIASLPALQRFYHPDAYHIYYPEQTAVDYEALNTPFV